MKEIIIAIITSIITSIITYLFTSKLEVRKERREDEKDRIREQKETYEKRPEMEIVEFKDYLSRPGYGIKQKCDIELFVAHIDHVTIKENGKKGKKQKQRVIAHYNPEDKDAGQWCCVIYTIKNMGKTDVSTTDIICTHIEDTCIFPCSYAPEFMEVGALIYSECYDRKIRSGETVTLKLCYHKERVITGLISAIITIGMQDDNGNYWQQPLFAPYNRVYGSKQVSWDSYRNDLRPDIVI